jgi:eukaryotic-like serine/threonine-protein kinase
LGKSAGATDTVAQYGYDECNGSAVGSLVAFAPDPKNAPTYGSGSSLLLPVRKFLGFPAGVNYKNGMPPAPEPGRRAAPVGVVPLMPTEAPPSPPRQIGSYDILSKIAEGGMGAVYRGRSQHTGQIVAIKVIPPETAKNPVLLKRFEQEFRAASLLDHPNVVKAVEYCGVGPNPFLVMEFVDGESLGMKVEREGIQDEAYSVGVIAQICDGLHRAHKQGLIHRDVKPDNILVTRDGVAKLTDMGLVKDVEGELNLTKTGRGLGTPHFMAPEQFRNAKNADVRCDVYSLGATLYMALTGEVPFAKTSPLDCWMRKVKNEFPPPRQLNPKVSERVNWAILRAMGADPEKRPASCREFMEDLLGVAWKPSLGVNVTQPPLERPALSDLWYLVYRDASGTPHTVKGTTDSIRQNLKAGTLGDVGAVVVCRTKTGQFEPLKIHPEFRDLVIMPGVVSPTSGSSRNPKAARTVDINPAMEPETDGNPQATRRLKIPQVPAGATGEYQPEYDPNAATELHQSAKLPHIPVKREGGNRPTKPRDMTPIFVAIIAALAAAVGFLLFTR